MVSPAPTVIALPPSQLQLPAELGLRTTEPAPGVAAASLVAGWTGCACAPCGASGRLSTRPTGCPCGTPCATEPVVSLPRPNGLSCNRDASLLHAATPIVISVSAAARGQDRARNISRTRDIATHSHAIQVAS